MLASPDTEQLGLRGLFLEAQREGELEAARQFAERALALNPKLGWPVEALFDLQCHAGDWQGALDTLAIGRRNGLVDKTVAKRRRAVLLTAQAQAAEDTGTDKALELALEAHRLAPDLVPAAAIAGRILASRGNTPRAARVLLKTWRLVAASRARRGLCLCAAGRQPARPAGARAPSRPPHAQRYRGADRRSPSRPSRRASGTRRATRSSRCSTDRLTQRVCTLMARIEGEQHGHTGRVREWLARAVNAPRDPAWTADGVVSDHWAPISPVTGALDAFRWRVPVEATDESAAPCSAPRSRPWSASAPSRSPSSSTGSGPAACRRDRARRDHRATGRQARARSQLRAAHAGAEDVVVLPPVEAASPPQPRSRRWRRRADARPRAESIAAARPKPDARRDARRSAEPAPQSRQRRAIAPQAGSRGRLGRASRPSPRSSFRRGLPTIRAPRSSEDDDLEHRTRSARRRPRHEQSPVDAVPTRATTEEPSRWSSSMR